MQIQINDNFETFAITYARRIGINFQFRENSKFLAPSFSVFKEILHTVKVSDNEMEYFQNIKQFLLENFKQFNLNSGIAYVQKNVKKGDFVKIYNFHFIATSEDSLTEITTQEFEIQRSYLDSFHSNNFQPSEGFFFS